nr:L-fucose kinase-like [Pocillopora verrucosa]
MDETAVKTSWTAIVLTCQNKTSARTLQTELELRQSKGLISKDTLVLALEDPRGGVGSGGATLNALLVVTEHLSAKAGFQVANESVLENANILLMHMGGDFPFSPCGRFFNTLPAKHSEESKENLYDALVTNFDYMLHVISETLSANAPAGVWICSADMLPSVDPQKRIDWNKLSDEIIVILSQENVQYAKDHGVVKLGEEGKVKDIIFRETEDEIRKCALSNGKVPVVVGTVYMNAKVASKMLNLHVFHPLDACTYYGLDNGAEPIQLSMIFDILLCLAEDVSESDFVCGERSGSYGRRNTRYETSRDYQSQLMLMRSARAQLWKSLRGLQLKGVLIENGTLDYMNASGECYRRQMLSSTNLLNFSGKSFDCNRLTHVTPCMSGSSSDYGSSVVINSIIDDSIIIGKDSVVSHCHLKGGMQFGCGSILIGLTSKDLEDFSLFGLSFPSDMCIIRCHISLPGLDVKQQTVLVAFGVHDDLQVPYMSPNSTFCNTPWKKFFDRAGISSEEVWLGVPEQERCLWNAKLFPVVYFNLHDEKRDVAPTVLELVIQILFSSFSTEKSRTDPNQNQVKRSDTHGLPSVLGDRIYGFEEVILRWRSSVRLSLKEIMSLIDSSSEFAWRKKLWFEIGKAQVNNTLKNCTNDCLLPFLKGCVKEGFAKDTLDILDQVASTATSPGVVARTLACIADVLGVMAGERAGLRSGPARNESWVNAFDLLDKGDIPAGVKALAEERSRWLDRPDLLIRAARHYEGAEQILRRRAVFTAKQFFVTEKCKSLPIGHWVIAEAPARADLSGCWTDTPPITYEHGGAVLTVAINLNGKKVTGARVRKIQECEIVLVIHSGEHSVKVVCRELSDLANFTQPHAPGALLKACICFLDIVTLPSSEKLSEQLFRKYQAGFELHTWSTAPQGSGLGTSSILAGVILAALLRSTGCTASIDSLIHAVMIVEQMLTTGGGWQDNVGGLMPGFNIARSQAALPLKVEVEKLNLPQATIDAFAKRLLCIYSGKPRLAKNLLQDVVRNWYARFPKITVNADDLVKNAEEAAKALRGGNIEKLGECMNCYRKQKCIMASGTEPKGISEMMKALEPLVLGQTLTGAGGGGFLVLLTKEPNMADKVRAVIERNKPSDELAFFEASIDLDGLTVRVEEDWDGLPVESACHLQ